MVRETFQTKRGHEARALFDQGLSCRQIAKQLDVGVATVARWAKAEGLAFDRAQTKAATEARQVDLAVARVRLAEKMLHRSEEMLDALDSPYLVYNFGGKDNTYEEHTLQRAPVEVRRNAVVTAGITFDKLTRIVEREAGGTESAVGLLDHVASALGAAADALRDEGSTDAGPE